jgi:hypothetical protein
MLTAVSSCPDNLLFFICVIATVSPCFTEIWIKNFVYINFHNEVYILCLPCRPNMNSVIHNLLNKAERVLTELQTKDVTSPSQSVKPGEVHNAGRLSPCFGVHHM